MLRAIMGISARAISLADRPQRAMWVTRVRMRREDRSSISFLADPGVSRRYKRSEGERGSKKKLLHRSLLSIWPVSFGRAAGVQWKARHCGRATALDYSVGAGDLLDGVSEDPPGLVYVTARRASLEADTPWSFRPRPWTCSSAPKTWSVKPNTKQVLDRIAWLCCQRAR